MTELSPWLRCALAVLAAWRVTHLLAAEDGPGDILVRLRGRLGNHWYGKLLDCFYCLSLWIAAPLTFWLSSRPADVIVAWLAISGGACLVERCTEAPVVIEQLKGESDVLLRSETREAADRAHVGHAASA